MVIPTEGAPPDADIPGEIGHAESAQPASTSPVGYVSADDLKRTEVGAAQTLTAELKDIMTKPERAGDRADLRQRLISSGFPAQEVDNAFGELSRADFTYNPEQTTLASDQPFDPNKIWTPEGKNLEQVRKRLREAERFIRDKYYETLERVYDRTFERGFSREDLINGDEQCDREFLKELRKILETPERTSEFERAVRHIGKLRELEKKLLEDFGDRIDLGYFEEFQYRPDSVQDKIHIFPQDVNRLFPELWELKANKPNTDTPSFLKEAARTIRDILNTLPEAVPYGLGALIIYLVWRRMQSGSGQKQHPA